MKAISVALREQPRCNCKGLPRFTTDGNGGTWETCDCGYFGPLRGTSQIERDVVMPFKQGPRRASFRRDPVMGFRKCRACLMVKPVADYWETERRCRACLAKRAKARRAVAVDDDLREIGASIVPMRERKGKESSGAGE